jgi:hypothetical protein
MSIADEERRTYILGSGAYLLEDRNSRRTREQDSKRVGSIHTAAHNVLGDSKREEHRGIHTLASGCELNSSSRGILEGRDWQDVEDPVHSANFTVKSQLVMPSKSILSLIHSWAGHAGMGIIQFRR